MRKLYKKSPKSRVQFVSLIRHYASGFCHHTINEQSFNLEPITITKVDISELIIKLTEGELSDKEKEELKQKLYNNPKLMQEYLTQVQLNDFLKKEFNAEQIEQDVNKESAEEKSLAAEKEALETGAFRSTVDHVRDWQEKKTEKELLDELKEFASIGLKEKKQEHANFTKKQNPTPKIILLKKWHYAVAAIAALFVLSFLVIKYTSSSADNKALFAYYYQPYHFFVEQDRSNETLDDSLINTAIELYKSEKYNEALELLNSVLEETNEPVKAHFIIGLSHIEAKNYKAATGEFNWILDNHVNYHLESKWYLALCYLKLDETKKAQKLLIDLSTSKNLYQERATVILTQLQE